MSKPATTVAIGAVSVAVLALFIALRDGKRSIPPASQTDPISEPAPTPQPEPVDEPAPPVASAAAELTPLPRPLATAADAPPAPAPVTDVNEPLAEDSLLTQLHDLAGSDPDLSLKLARKAVDRFPDSPNAPEFEWNAVKALFNLGRLADAEAEARVMLAKYPDSSFTGDVEHHLLNHPPNPSDVP